MKKLLYIYNPNAGRQRSRAILSEALEALAGEGYRLTVVPTAGPGDALESARCLAPDHDRVVCCGGDGTLNEVVRGLLELPEKSRPVLGYLPMGSTNDFSRNLDLPKTVPELARFAASGEGRYLDLGMSCDRPFTYVSAFGLFTEVTYTTPQSMKNLLGHFAYLLEGAGQLVNVPSYPLTVISEGQDPIEGEFIFGMVGNTVSAGGVMRLPRELVKLNDGQFEALLVRKPRSLKDWQEIISNLTNLQLPCSGAIEAFSTKEVTFRCDRPVAWTVDGEFGGERNDTTVKVMPHSLRVACNIPEP